MWVSRLPKSDQHDNLGRPGNKFLNFKILKLNLLKILQNLIGMDFRTSMTVYTLSTIALCSTHIKNEARQVRLACFLTYS